MAYSTGSGTYTQMMDAVAVHAVADGWVEDGGGGSGFPISKGVNRGVDFTTFTQSDQNVTAGYGGGSPFTARYMRLGIGTTPALATTDAASADCLVPNMSFTITAWHIFSDTTLCDYIHVAFQFGNGVDSDLFQHFSFGEIDAQGMTHGGIAYASSRYSRGYALNSNSGTAAADWNSLNRSSFHFAGNVGEKDNGLTELRWMINGPTPVDAGASYPAVDILQVSGNNVWDCIRMGGVLENPASTSLAASWKLAWCALIPQPMPFAGSVSLMPLPFVITNGGGTGNFGTWCGQFPNVRYCSMTGHNPGDEITFAGETWKLFPWLKKTDNSVLNDASIVASGTAGFAYKKVL